MPFFFGRIIRRTAIVMAPDMLYNSNMLKKYLSGNASPQLIEYLKDYDLRFVDSQDIVSSGISDHADVFYCRLGCRDDAEVLAAEPTELAPGYPAEAAFNAACTGRYFIHKTDITSSRLLAAAKEKGMELIDVRQGYCKCSTVIVDEESIITYDKAIAAPCQAAGMSVLLVSPGHVKLRGYDTGFIGGASGRCGGEIIFNGDLTAHPDHENIIEFIESRGLTCRWFSDYPLTDIGSII